MCCFALLCFTLVREESLTLMKVHQFNDDPISRNVTNGTHGFVQCHEVSYANLAFAWTSIMLRPSSNSPLSIHGRPHEVNGTCKEARGSCGRIGTKARKWMSNICRAAVPHSLTHKKPESGSCFMSGFHALVISCSLRACMVDNLAVECCWQASSPLRPAMAH